MLCNDHDDMASFSNSNTRGVTKTTCASKESLVLHGHAFGLQIMTILCFGFFFLSKIHRRSLNLSRGLIQVHVLMKLAK